LFICNREKAKPEIIHWLNSLGFALGQTEAFLSVPGQANYQGMLDMGMLPDYLPGYQRLDNPMVLKRMGTAWDAKLPDKNGKTAWRLIDKIKQGQIPGLIFWQQDPVGTAELDIQKPENSLIIVADMFMTETAKIADIVFPIVPFTESAGTVTNGEGRVQFLKNVLKPLTGMPNWRILAELAEELSEASKFKSVDEVTNEILEIVPEYKKEFAVFRNGYMPRTEILVDARSRNLPYGANYLEKWFDLFRTRTYPSDIKKNVEIMSPQEVVE